MIDKVSGAKIVPDIRWKEQIGFTWRLVRNKYGKGAPSARFAENAMFLFFAAAAVDPRSEAAEFVLTLEPDELARQIVEMAGG